ncbi:Protein maternal effect lethal 26 [Dirofilaria immitis]|nr:Protein maternal effect lethal 26 [Dirofilaria immitis]
MEPSNSELSMPIESSSTLGSHSSNSSQTEIRVEHVKHSWTVKNFSHCYQEYLENFVHLHRGEDTLTWSIKIYPKGNGENNKDFVFYALIELSITRTHRAKMEKLLHFTDQRNERDRDAYSSKSSHSDYVSYIKRDVLFPQILPNDSIIVNVEIDVAVETVTTTLEEMLTNNSEQQLTEDYLKMLKDNVLTDFAIKVGEREIKVHRAILAARSPVFAAMLRHEDTNEAKTGVMVIEDLEYDTVTEMLNFIYCGHCLRDVNEFAFASDLLIAADKYRLEELKSEIIVNVQYKASHHLSAVDSVIALTFENVCELLIVSDIYSAPRLRHRAVEFIIQHPRNITSTPGWDNVVKQHHDLVTDISISLVKTRKIKNALMAKNWLPAIRCQEHKFMLLLESDLSGKIWGVRDLKL